jgi:hypothetical protein
MDAQKREIKRTQSRIAHTIMDFCEHRLKKHLGNFRMVDLETYVRSRVDCAPDSPSRILRQLNRSGALSYYCSNRAMSTYNVYAIPKEECPSRHVVVKH